MRSLPVSSMNFHRWLLWGPARPGVATAVGLVTWGRAPPLPWAILNNKLQSWQSCFFFCCTCFLTVQVCRTIMLKGRLCVQPCKAVHLAAANVPRVLPTCLKDLQTAGSTLYNQTRLLLHNCPCIALARFERASVLIGLGRGHFESLLLQHLV